MATGYEMMKGIPRKGNRIISSWSIATRPQPRAIWPTAAMIWEAADPYLYIRTTPRGEVICGGERSEEHTSELQSLMRISYAVFCLKKKKTAHIYHQSDNNNHILSQ